MKRLTLVAAAVLILLSMTSCSVEESCGSDFTSVSSDSTEFCAQPNQEMLFLTTTEVFSDSPYITEATLFTTDGRILNASEAIYDADHNRREDWENYLMQLVQEDHTEPSVPQNDLYRMYHFFEQTDMLDESNMTEYAERINDAGKNYLYLLQKQDDGSYRQVQLCVSGETNKYMNTQTVIQFCEWMTQQHYYEMNM